MILSSIVFVIAPTSPRPKSTTARDIVSYHFILCYSIGSQTLPFLRLHSVEAGGLLLRNKNNIQCNSAGLSSDSHTALKWGLEDEAPSDCACEYSAFPLYWSGA